MTVKLELLFPGDATWTNATSLVRSASPAIRERLFNGNLESAIDSFEIALRYDQTIVGQFLAATDRILAKVYDESDASLFTGYIPPTLAQTKRTRSVVGPLQLEILDNSYLLDERLSSSFQYPATIGATPYKVLDSADTANSIVHELLTLAGYTAVDTIDASCPDVTSTVVHVAGTEGEETYREFLDQLLMEHGYVMHWTAAGKFTLWQWDQDTVTATVTLENQWGADGLAIEKREQEYDGAKLEWAVTDTITDARLYQDASPLDSSSGEEVFQGHAIAAGDYYPADGDVKDTYQRYVEQWLDQPYLSRATRLKNKDLSLITTSGHSVQMSADANVAVDTAVYESHRAQVLFQNSGAGTEKLYWFDILGDALIRAKREVYTVPTTAKQPLEYTSRFVFDSTRATRLANALNRHVLYSDFQYGFSMRDEYAVGTIVRILQTDPGIDTAAVIVDREHNYHRPMWRYRAIALVEYAGATIQVQVSAPPVVGTEAQRVQEQLDAHPTYTQVTLGFDAGGGTTTPTAPAFDSAAAQGRIANLRWEAQDDLTAPHVVDIQRKKGVGGTYATIATVPGSTTTYTDVPTLDADGNSQPIDTVYYYQIRRRTTGSSSQSSSWTETGAVTVGPYTTADLGEGSVDVRKVVDAAITNAKLDNLSVDSAKLADGAATVDKIAALAVTAAKIAADAVLTSKLSVLARNLHNNPTLSGTIRGWGGIREDGSGSSSVAAYDATETALRIRSSSSDGVRHDTFEVDPNQIYRVRLEAKKTAAMGTITAGVRTATTEEDGADSGSAGSVNAERWQYGDVTKEWALYSTTSNAYWWSTTSGSSPTSYVSLEVFLVGANRNVTDCLLPTIPAHAGAGDIGAIKVLTGHHCSLRILNGSNTSQQDVFIKNVSITPVGSGQIVAQNIVAEAITAGKIAASAITAAEIDTAALFTELFVMSAAGIIQSDSYGTGTGFQIDGDGEMRFIKNNLKRMNLTEAELAFLERPNTSSEWAHVARIGGDLRGADFYGDVLISGRGRQGAGRLWRDVTHPLQYANAIAFGNDVYVAAGAVGEIARSTDGGETWGSLITNPLSASYSANASVYGNGTFIIGTSGGELAYSTDDGATWTLASTNPFNGVDQVRAVAYGNGYFVAAGNNGRIARSTDGSNWGSFITDHSFGTADLLGVAYGNEVFVIVGQSGDIARSTDDGASWSSLIANPFGTNLIGAVTFGNGIFVAGAYPGSLARSTDNGASWGSLLTNPFGTVHVYSIAFGGGVFVAVGGAVGSGGEIAISTDNAASWEDSLIPSPLGSSVIDGVAYGDQRFVAVADVQIAISEEDRLGAGIVEKGENTSGQYIKFSDGMMVAHDSHEGSTTGTTTLSLPATFLYSSNGDVNVWTGMIPYGGASWVIGWCESGIEVKFRSGVAHLSNVVTWGAIGRWK